MLFLMIFSLVIDNSFKIISPDLVKFFGVSASTVSWQVTLSGLVIGMGAIIYASLSDSISIRNLLTVGISLICIGSLLGYLVHTNYWLVVVARVIQSAGLGATETLYLIFVTKYLSPTQQKKFMGFSTSSFQIATVIGTLTGGFIATYLEWQHLFLIPLLTVFLIPILWRYLPNESSGHNHIDVIGLLLVGAVSTSILLCISSFSWLVFFSLLGLVALFAFYLTKNQKAFISIDFFKNKIFIAVLATGFIVYTTYSAYALNTLSFLLTDLYHVQLANVSLMFIPACIGAAIVGALSGQISQLWSSKKCVYVALGLIIVSIFISMFIMKLPIILFNVLLIIFSCCYALMYAPLIDTGLQDMPKNTSGTALGFYNLSINVATAIGFTYSAFLIDNVKIRLPLSQSDSINHYAGILCVIGCIACVSLVIFHFVVARLIRKH